MTNLPENNGWRNSWGLWDKNGKKDIHGALSLLTNSVLKEAYRETRDGYHVSLNWPLNAIETPGFVRKGLVHKPIAFIDTPMKTHGYDDEVEFNMQCSSQWRSLIHFHHQASASGYNGIQTSAEELRQDHGREDREGRIPTLDHWHERGRMVARGVLIDFKKFADEMGRKFSPFDADQISIEDIDEVARKKSRVKVGDVVVIRSGFTEALTGISGEEQEKLLGTWRTCGVTGSEERARWFWNKHFSAVASDAIAFEQQPPIIDGKESSIADLVLHQYFLGCLGMPIGELWDLKKLSETCEESGRYSFLLTIVPLNVPGAVGSPRNAIATF